MPFSDDAGGFEWDSKDEKASNHFLSVFDLFDFSFLCVVFFENFNQGFRRLLEYGLYNVFSHKLGLEPGEVTLLLGLMALPWCLMMFFAIISDNVTCCGSRRKSYLIVNTCVDIASMSLLMALGLKYGKYFIMACLITS